jgi:hypothetical protein
MKEFFDPLSKYDHDDPMKGNYEEKFEFPLWTLVKKIAEEEDLSYSLALEKALPIYKKGIRYFDEEFEDPFILKRQAEMAAAHAAAPGADKK